MSTSTITAPTPRAPRETLRTTLDDFRKDCVGWQREVSALFEDIDSFLSRDVQVRPAAHVPRPRDNSDISGLRSMIEQQTEILTALVSALAEQPSPSTLAAEPASPPQPTRRRERSTRRRHASDDESTGMLLRQFQELERMSHDEGR